jgi:hypothetical protein
MKVQEGVFDGSGCGVPRQTDRQTDSDMCLEMVITMFLT